MVYLVTSNNYRRLSDLVYISKDLNKIFDMLKNNELKFKATTKYDIEYDVNELEICNFDINERISKYSYGRENLKVDLTKKLVLDKDNKVIFNFNRDDNTDKLNEKQSLITKCYDLARKKQIPEKLNNYFLIIYKIEKESKNIDEDIDYLVSILLELESYEDKPKVSY